MFVVCNKIIMFLKHYTCNVYIIYGVFYYLSITFADCRVVKDLMSICYDDIRLKPHCNIILVKKEYFFLLLGHQDFLI